MVEYKIGQKVCFDEIHQAIYHGKVFDFFCGASTKIGDSVVRWGNDCILEEFFSNHDKKRTYCEVHEEGSKYYGKFESFLRESESKNI